MESNIAAGKSTFIEMFKNYPGAENFIEFIPIPIKEWMSLNNKNLLQMYYQRPRKYAYILQNYINLTIIQSHERKPSNANVTTRVFERSLNSAFKIFSINCMETQKLEAIEFDILREYYKFNSKKYKYDMIIYLRTSPEICFERLKKRNRIEENSITLEFLKEIHKLHDEWLKYKTNIITIDVTDDLCKLRVKYFECFEKIIKYLI